MSTITPIPLSTLKNYVATAFPSSDPNSIKLTRQPSIEGDDHMIFFIDREPHYLLRITKTREDRPVNMKEMHAQDIAIREYVRSAYRSRGLDGDVIPRCIGSWRVGEGDEECVVSLEERIRGVGLDRGTGSEATRDGLVKLLCILKSIDVDELEKELDIGLLRIPARDLMKLYESAEEAWKRLFERGQLFPLGLPISDKSLVEDLFEKKVTRLFAEIQKLSPHHIPSLIHNDLKGEHILIDESTGQITGILDWADAGIGDAAVDIAGLVITVGKDVAVGIARDVAYEEGKIAEGVVIARCECVLRLDCRLNGVDDSSPVSLLRDQLGLALRD
ncbi:Phosphotransferase enzyme family [Aspergillus sclerotialis]|uniref:Phosphotransferase enzyme family n=1 Tax=Aspergillus sclerotialis TaxID=2070753 RepID=A0A3A2ZNZ2_9EURO|nr:Phosphotransferase enzyme family [Aspergillus sclerotialis]